jgi:hypothetical protein
MNESQSQHIVGRRPIAGPAGAGRVLLPERQARAITRAGDAGPVLRELGQRTMPSSLAFPSGKRCPKERCSLRMCRYPVTGSGKYHCTLPPTQR